MKLPLELRIGRTWYTVIETTAIGEKAGWLNPQIGTLKVATGVWKKPADGCRARQPAEISETFWHEVTHAILHDMEHPLWKDEKFVTDFSKRLSKAIDSARFK